MRKILITGCTGFVGSHYCDYLLDNYPDVEIHGLLRWRSPLDNIKHCIDDLNLYYGDLEDLSSLQKIIREVKPDFIAHLAAQSYVPYSFDNPVATLNVNCIGTCNLLEAIKMAKQGGLCDPIVHIVSSSEVYGDTTPDEVPITENNPLRASSPYGVGKICEDMLGMQYWLSYQIKIIRTRMFTHSGPRRHQVFVLSNFAKQIVEIELGLKEPIVYVGNLESVRTFADVRDTVRAYWLLLHHCKYGEVYNIGGNTTVTMRELLDKLIDLSTRKDQITFQVDPKRIRPADVTLQIPCTDKFKKATNWEPKIPFETTAKDTLDYWRDKLSS